MEPILKWCGGKRKLLGSIVPLVRGGGRLIEPFAGGCAVAASLNRPAILNDACRPLVEFYRQVAQGMPLPPRPADRTDFAANRARLNELLAAGEYSQETAGLFLYVNRAGTNGIWRTNMKGQCNVAEGRGALTWPDAAQWRDFGAWLKTCQLSCLDFADLRPTDQDVIYIDPPYDAATNYYGNCRFGWQDQVRLARWLAGLPCRVVASNRATERVVALYRELGFRVDVGSQGYGLKGKVNGYPEMLATRPAELVAAA